MTPTLPPWLRRCVRTPEEALHRTVVNGVTIASGLATAEPTTFYAGLLAHVRAQDIHDLEIRQGLFLQPHPILVGDALDVDVPAWPGPLGRLADRVGDGVRLRRLLRHVEELQARRITLTSAFLGPVLNGILPDGPAARLLAGRLSGRNRVTAGLVRYQQVHFPDAAWALGVDETGRLDIDLLVLPMTWPRRQELSFGLSNGVAGDALPLLERDDRGHLLLYLNRRLPFTTGIDQTVPLQRLRPLADAGRLTVVVEDVEPPGLPPGAMSEATDVQRRIAGHVADHIGGHRDASAGRALQVGIGTISNLVVQALDERGWRGRGYTEMLDPGTYDLLDQGLIEGTHVLTDVGGRREREGLSCTFAMGERGSSFPDRLDGDERICMMPASRLLRPAAFHGGLGINNVLAIDLAGNVNASARDHHPHSGIGGLATITRGLAVGGVSYLCMPSTHRAPDGRRRSSVMAQLPPATPVALTPPDLMGTREGARCYLVTEHGVARLHARTHDEFLREVIAVADPEHAASLARTAWERYRVRTGGAAVAS